MQLQPGDVPCYVLLSGIQVPRVIGKGGAIIRELREESGATITILDRPPAIPEIFQRLEIRVAFIKGSDAAMHTAVTGIVRNARGPESVRQLEPGDDGDSAVVLLVPQACEEYLGDPELLQDTGCSLRISAMDEVRRHRRVHITGQETRGMQIVAWRVHSLVLRLARNQILADKDFDLQDSSWDVLMESYRSKRQGASANTSMGYASTQPTSKNGTAILSPVPEVAAFEAEAQKLRESREREAREREESNRKSRIREAQARDAQEREGRARQSRVLQEKARDTWARATRVMGSGDEYETLAREAQEYENQARNIWSQTLHGNGKLWDEARAQEQVVLESRAHESAVQDQAAANKQDELRREALEREAAERKVKEQEAAKQREEREREALARLAEQRAIREARERERQAKQAEAQQQMLLEREAREREAQEREAREREAQEHEAVRAHAPDAQEAEPLANGHDSSQASGSMREECNLIAPESSSKTAAPQYSSAAGTPGGEKEAPLFLQLPSVEVANFLASKALGISHRTGAVLCAGCWSSEVPVLRISGTPTASAMACYLVQEALWMSGAFHASSR